MAGENNFHILYYLFSSPKAQQLGLTSPRDFPYLATTPGLPQAARCTACFDVCAYVRVRVCASVCCSGPIGQQPT